MNLFIKIGAHNWTRTNDLFLTKEVLYRLSYVGVNPALTGLNQALKTGAGDGNRTHTISLEGWGSTIELHPLTDTTLLCNVN